MKKGISQELLRSVALVTMLIDHVGYALFPRLYFLRGIGRLAFPIFAFLLAEGAERTRNPGKYALRLVIAAILSELPFDFMIAGRITWDYQNVIITLLMGLGAIYALKLAKGKGPWLLALGCAASGLCAWAAELMKTDYGAFGVLTCLMFWLFWRLRFGPLICAAVFTAMCFWYMEAMIPGTRIPIEVLGVVSLGLMWLYRGRRISRNKALQWAFYLFYPVHMALIAAIRLLR